MDLTSISPDQTVYWRYGLFSLNATLVYTWAVMALLALGSWVLTRRLSTGREVSRWQMMLEVVIDFIRQQIREVTHEAPTMYLPFIGTLFLFIAMSNVLTIVPGWVPPTASLSTTTALALAVFIAVPIYGIVSEGIGRFLRHYVSPSWVMLPFNIIGELSRTLALAVRLFGNAMSGTKIVGVLIAVAPLVFPVVMRLLGLITGLVQAYIFAVLALVYIAAGTEARRGREGSTETKE